MERPDGMDPAPSETRGDEGAQIDELVLAYIDRLNAGERIDRKEILERHPDVASELLECLETFADLGRNSGDGRPIGTIGDYTLRRRIGRGGMGVVYDAWQHSMERRVALKVLPSGIAADNKIFLRFMREAKIAGQLSHPNIVHVHGIGVEEDTPYYAMECVDGETLSQILARQGDAGATGLDLDDHARLAGAFAEVADGLQHAHSKGVIHRDIKPSNLILDPEGRLRILDFGLARLEGQESLTTSGDTLGTPLYMSPEQARRHRIRVDHRTDLYSLGATMYEALTHRPPIRGKDHQDTLAQIIERDPAAPRSVNPRIPEGLEVIVLKCLRKDPEDRYGTAEALAQDLRRFVRGDPIEARPESGVTRWLRGARAHRHRIATVTIVFALAILAVWLGLERWSRVRLAARILYEKAVEEAVEIRYRGRLTARAHISPIRPVPMFESLDRVGSPGLERDPVDRAIESLQGLEARTSEGSEASYHLGRAFLLKGRIDDARRAFARCLERRPDFAPARYFLADLNGEDTVNAGPSDPPWVDPWIEGQRAFRERRWDEAARAFGDLMQLEAAGGRPYLGADIEIRMPAAIALLESGDPLGASQILIEGRMLRRESLEQSLLLAVAYHRMGLADAVRRTFQGAYDVAASHDEAAYWIVATARFLGDYETAIAWTASIEAPLLRHQVEAVLRIFSEDYAGAVAAARKAAAAGPQSALARSILALALVQNLESRGGARVQAELEEAISAARRAEEIAPDDPLCQAILGYALQRTGEDDDAGGRIERALEKDPDRPIVILIAGLAYMEKRGERRRAEATFRRLVDVTSGTGLAHEEAIGRVYLGYIYRDRGMIRAALEEWRRALEILHFGAGCNGLGGLYLYWLGDPYRAEAYFRQAIKHGPHRAFRYAELARALAAQGDMAGALEAVDAAIERSDDDPEFHALRGDLEAGLDRLEPALSSTLRALDLEIRAPVFTHLERLLRRMPPGPGDARLDSVLDRCFELIPNPVEPALLSAGAMLLLRSAGRRDRERALEFAERAVERSGGRSHDALATLGVVQYETGARVEAVRTLEEASRGPDIDPHTPEILRRYREALPGMCISYATVDARGIDPAAASEATLGAQAESDGSDPMEQAARAYRAARILQVRGELEAAERAFREIAEADPEGSEPHLRIAECLARRGAADASERVLRDEVASGPCRGHELWDAWLTLCLTEVGLEPAEILSRMGEPAKDEPWYREDMRWALKEWCSTPWIGILCGASEDREIAGRRWSRDRLFLGGKVRCGPAERCPNPTPVDRLYESVRRFPAGMTGGGYVIPLPRGLYRITVHIASRRCGSPAAPPGEILAEGRPLEGCEDVPLELTDASRRHSETRIEDGFLDLRVQPGPPGLHLAAVEIERLADGSKGESDGPESPSDRNDRDPLR
ncbi:MAG: protein kinase [Planctomycetes bacterium]|nr:protein kinase [Planctomycetota bacterium]